MYLLSTNNCHSKKANKLLNIGEDKEINDHNLFKERINPNMSLFFKIFSIILLSVLLLLVIDVVTVGYSQTELIEVKVIDGDNLWKIADKYYSEDIDLRKKIFEIKKMNKLETAMLQPGQKIKIPVSK